MDGGRDGGHAAGLALYAAALRDGRLLSSRSMQFVTAWFPAGDWGQVGHNLFRVEHATGPAIIGHDGDVLGFTGSFYWVEGTDTVVAVLCNVGSMHSGEVPGTAYSVATKLRFIELATKVARSIPHGRPQRVTRPLGPLGSPADATESAADGILAMWLEVRRVTSESIRSRLTTELLSTRQTR